MGVELSLPGLELPPERPAPPPKFCSVQEWRVYDALRWGADNATQVPELARKAGVGQRQLQRLLKHLLFDHGQPVGTSMRKPFGNYLMADAEEIAATIHLLSCRGVHSLARASALKGEALARHMEHVQTHLDIYLEELDG